MFKKTNKYFIAFNTNITYCFSGGLAVPRWWLDLVAPGGTTTAGERVPHATVHAVQRLTQNQNHGHNEGEADGCLRRWKGRPYGQCLNIIDVRVNWVRCIKTVR